MQLLFRHGVHGAAVLLGGALLLLTAAPLEAKPERGAPARSGFRLLARPLAALTVNRVYCGLSNDGNICTDSLGSSTIGGGFWPKGTPDQYVFNSGMQVAGIIGPDGGPWANDTTGGFFFDPKGTTVHGRAVTPIWNATDRGDLANWPKIAYVPTAPDPQAELFSAPLRGRPTASEGDVWWLSWEGNPSQNSGRPHPLGILVEHRGLAYNSPAGNQDILYFLYTFYNITSLDAADYAGYRPEMSDTLLTYAQQFHQLNNARFGVDLPDEGYTITNLFANFGADMDVASAGENYASVNLPFNLGYTYEYQFSQPTGWVFPADIFGQAPFFAGAGFVGVKYLKSPINPDTGEEQGLSVFSNTSNGGQFGDPQNTDQLYRYISGNIDPAKGDDNCNVPGSEIVCFINNAAPNDMRFFQSSGPLNLAPGQSGTIVVAYVFAAPVGAGACTAPGCDVSPGDLQTIANLDNAAYVTANGVNLIDQISGWVGFTDQNGDGTIQQTEVEVVPGSLLGKAKVAQTVFDLQFLQPAAPDAPEFFLVPGDNKVTVLWRPSGSEPVERGGTGAGDSYFSVASSPTNPDGTTNLIYDPNYRQFDVEGYRVFRGRVDNPAELTMIAQFDHAGTEMVDRLGVVTTSETSDPVLSTCAPEIAVYESCTPAGTVAGVALVEPLSYDLVGTVIQVRSGDRILRGDGLAQVMAADTTPTGKATAEARRSGPALANTGVPFIFVDDGTNNLNGVPAPRNNFRYFYSVVAFDINSFRSGPSLLESARNTKAVVPRAPASNFSSTGELADPVFLGRGVELDAGAALPTIDPDAGTFSGPFPPADRWDAAFAAFATDLLEGSGDFTIRMDSIDLGSDYANVPHTYWFTVTSGGFSQRFAVPMPLGDETEDSTIVRDSTASTFNAVRLDPQQAARFGGSSQYFLQGSISLGRPTTYYTTVKGRGCVNHAFGFDRSGAAAGGCEYNGGRWFAGPSPANNETQADPHAGNTANFESVPMANYNNAGALPGVTTIFQPGSYQSMPSTYRAVEGILDGAFRAADYNVHWGAGGTIDSVVDVTHNVAVPFQGDELGGTWGVLNQSAALPSTGTADGQDLLTVADFGCVAPLNDPDLLAGFSGWACAGGPEYQLSQTVVPGPIGFYSGGQDADPTAAAPAPNAGFGMYLAGQIYLFELEGGAVPAAGTVWSVRNYIGAISGGQGDAGDFGPYVFTPAPRMLTAVGTEIRVGYSATNTVRETRDADLDRVHTVPDPYYVTNTFEQTTDTKVIKFVNLPQDAIIRIYSSSGVLVNLIEHHSNSFGGEATWNVRNRNNQVVASGVYFYHIESFGARKVGRFTVINFAQ